jgi:hypothetical protein
VTLIGVSDSVSDVGIGNINPIISEEGALQTVPS